MSFLGELRRRKVLQVAIVYAAVAWLLVQIIVSVEEPLQLPTWMDTFVIVVVIIGFPLAIVLAWAFQMTPDGVVRTQVGPDSAVDNGGPAKVEDEAAPNAMASLSESTIGERMALAVLPFNNISGDTEQEYFADGLTEDLITALSRWRSPTKANRPTYERSLSISAFATLSKEACGRRVTECASRRN